MRKCFLIITGSSYKCLYLCPLWKISLIPNVCSETFFLLVGKTVTPCSTLFVTCLNYLQGLSIQNIENFTSISFSYLKLFPSTLYFFFPFHFLKCQGPSSLSLLGFFGDIYLHCPFAQHIFSHLSSKSASQLLACFATSRFLICLLRFLFHCCHITYKVTCLQAIYFLPCLIFPFAPSACVYVINALRLVKLISNWVDPITALKIRNLFSCASVSLLITLLGAMREFL